MRGFVGIYHRKRRYFSGLPIAKNVYKANPVTQKYETRAKNLLKAELKRRGLSYRDLAEKLTAIGVGETERNLNNKISRGDSQRLS